MTLTIELSETDEAAWNAEAARLGMTPGELFQQAAREKMQAQVAGLKDRRAPQALDELRPRRLPPPGKTVWDVIAGQWPGDETDEEARRVLEELS